MYKDSKMTLRYVFGLYIFQNLVPQLLILSRKSLPHFIIYCKYITTILTRYMSTLCNISNASRLSSLKKVKRKKRHNQSESRFDNGVFSNDLSHTFLYRNRTRFRIHRPSVEHSLVLIVASVKYNRGSEKNIENCFFPINLRPGALTFCNKGVLQKLKRHGNGGSCFKQHEKLKIKIFAERVMKSHIYSSIDFYIGISKKHFL